MVTESDILNSLRHIQDPDLGKDIVSLGFIKNIVIEGSKISLNLELTTPACPVKDELKQQVEAALLKLPGVKETQVTLTAQVRSKDSPQKNQMLPNVKNIIPVASGKGGVGKSTVSANLAIALSRLGARVGLMDADVYGPSIPILMGSHEEVQAPQGKMIPPSRFGIKMISMGYFLKEGDAVIWRGPLLVKMLDQFLGAVDWGELDYLIVDLPPGTGDIQLNLCQRIALTGAVIVSTPQELAFQVAEKAISMFKKLNTPILGLIENMTGDIFGKGGARHYALAHHIPFLGEIPLLPEIRVASDKGEPIVHSDTDSEAAQAYIRVAENIAAQVSIQNFGEIPERPEPIDISQPSPQEVKIQWSDGKTSFYTAHQLRTACRCAACINEMTGEKILKDDSVAADIHADSISPVGRYALHFNWSDGHTSGIYTYDYLRHLALQPTKS